MHFIQFLICNEFLSVIVGLALTSEQLNTLAAKHWRFVNLIVLSYCLNSNVIKGVK